MIGVADPLKGQVPRGFVVLKAGARRSTPTQLADELVAKVRDEIGPVAAFRTVAVVAGAAQDPLGQDPAQDDARDRRRQGRRAVPSTIEDAGGARHARPLP